MNNCEIMFKLLLKILIVIVFLNVILKAQPTSFDRGIDLDTAKLQAKSIMYADLFYLGGGLYYERMINKNYSLKVGFNYGGGEFGTFDESFAIQGFGLPIIINFMTKGNHKFEFGLGGGLLYKLEGELKSNIVLVPAFNAGYRYQELIPSLILRAGAGYLCNFNLFYISVGYSFK